MQAISSPTSSGRSQPSRQYRPLLAWSLVAAVQIALAFTASVAANDEAADDTFYRYEFALGNLVVYAVLAGLTALIASRTGDMRGALGLRRFAARWVWIAIG